MEFEGQYEGDLEDFEEDYTNLLQSSDMSFSSPKTLEDVVVTKRLKIWLMKMEEMIEPVSLKVVRNWTGCLRRERLAEIQVLNDELEIKGKEIRELLSSAPEESSLKRRVERLDTHWRKIWLRSFEWLCLLEQGGPEQLELKESSSSSCMSSPETSSQNHQQSTPVRQSDRPTVYFGNDTSIDWDKSKLSHIECDIYQDRVDTDIKDYTNCEITRGHLGSQTSDNKLLPENLDNKLTSDTNILPEDLDRDLSLNKRRGYTNMEGDPADASMTVLLIQQELSRSNKKHITRTKKVNSFTHEYNSEKSEYENVSLNTSAFARDSETYVSQEEAKHSDQVVDISDFWDKEPYLSEYNYDEPIDVETAKKILNFGDDYRNFIDSQSDLASPRQPIKPPRRRRSQKENMELDDVSNSDDEINNISEQISECSKDFKEFEDNLKTMQLDGFKMNNNNDDSFTVELQKGKEKINLLTKLLGNSKESNTFAARKFGREVRFLQSKGKILEKEVREYLEQENIFQSLSSDILVLKSELERQRSKMEMNKTFEQRGDLGKYLMLLKVSMSDLSSFKTSLFDLNLRVHGLLGELSTVAVGKEGGARHLQAEDLRAEVVKLYAAWDMCNVALGSSIKLADENVKNVENIERNILDFKESLKKEENQIKKMKSKNIGSDDSGFSDTGSSSKITSTNIDAKKEHFKKITGIVHNLFHYLPVDSPVLSGLNDVLKDTSSQLNNLSVTIQSNKSKPGISYYKSVWTRVRKYSKFFIFLLNILGVVSIFLRPDCCESRNNFRYYPQFSYVNGPPPI